MIIFLGNRTGKISFCFDENNCVLSVYDSDFIKHSYLIVAAGWSNLRNNIERKSSQVIHTKSKSTFSSLRGYL